LLPAISPLSAEGKGATTVPVQGRKLIARSLSFLIAGCALPDVTTRDDHALAAAANNAGPTTGRTAAASGGVDSAAADNAGRSAATDAGGTATLGAGGAEVLAKAPGVKAGGAAGSSGSDGGPTPDPMRGEPNAGGPNANTMTGPQTAGRCPAATSVDADGPLVPTHVAQVGPNGNSWVFFPEGFGKDGMKLPVFNWGTPTNQGPAEFMGPLNRLASHGFVVIGQVLTTSGSAALDWILAENARSDSMFYQKLDPTRVGRGGTGGAAGQTFAEAKDPRLSLYVVVCGGNSGGGDAASPANFHAPAIILGGEDDAGWTPAAEAYYDAIQTPVAFVKKTGTNYFACAQANLAPWLAFMRWQFCGEAKFRPDFLTGGTYCANPWSCRSKGIASSTP
jgi:hypothetical protein